MILGKIEAKCDFGEGRQAIAVLNKHFGYEMQKLSRKAVSELVKLKCTGYDNVEKFLLEFQRLCRILVEASEAMAEPMKLELLLKQMMNVKQLGATLAAFAALPEKDQISATLIEWVEKFVEQNQQLGGKAVPAKGKPDGGGRGGGGA